MIFIFHGDDQVKSRQALLAKIHQNPDCEVFHPDSRTINLDQINNFLFGPTLFSHPKILWLDNFFSISKPILAKLIPLLGQSDVDAYLWQDKALTPTQLKTFPKSQIQLFRLDNLIFKCLYAIKPKNLHYCLPLYHQIIKSNYYDLFLYLLKNRLHKNLNSANLPAYLKLIELDYQNKTGQLTLPKEIALERVLINLVS